VRCVDPGCIHRNGALCAGAKVYLCNGCLPNSFRAGCNLRECASPEVVSGICLLEAGGVHRTGSLVSRVAVTKTPETF
jgi:hypothetical protein